MKSRLFSILALMIIALAGATIWYQTQGNNLPQGIYQTNGRLEAEQVEVATKTAGRIAEVLVREGQMVQAGDLLVTIDNKQLLAKKREAQAQINAANLALEEANAGVAQRESALTLASQELKRTQTMYKKQVAPKEKLDQAQAQYDSASAALRLAKATAARTLASIDAANAALAELEDSSTHLERPLL